MFCERKMLLVVGGPEVAVLDEQLRRHRLVRAVVQSGEEAQQEGRARLFLQKHTH